MCLADVVFYYVIDFLNAKGATIDNFPLLNGLYDRINVLPQFVEYKSSDRYYPSPGVPITMHTSPEN